MLIVGERINTSRGAVRKAVEARDSSFIKNETRKQLEAGAQIIDVNCGTSLEKEIDDMAWLVEVVQGESAVRLCIDSPNAQAIKKALELHKGKALVNSISCEKSRYEEVLPLIKEYDCDVVALTMDERGIPDTAQERFELATIIIEIASRYGVSKDRIYIDPLVRPVSTEEIQPREFLKSLMMIKELNYKTIGGISNVSFGLPERALVNRTFLSMAIACGLDAVIMDPTDKGMMQTVLSSESVLGFDKYSSNYIRAFREGHLSKA